MFGLDLTGLLLVILVGLALGLVLSGSLLSWVNVNQRWHAAGEVRDLERALLRSLATATGRSLTASDEGRITVTQWRRPVWTIVLAVLTFPLGLLFLLHKVRASITVLITPDERGGSKIDLNGTTRRRTLDALTVALTNEHHADAEPLRARI